MPSEETPIGMAPQKRPFITLVIKAGSELSEGRLPLARRNRDGDLEVDLDPVSLAALFASAGRLFTVAQVVEEIARLQASEQRPGDPPKFRGGSQAQENSGKT